jgi:CDGSH-type Zn-finger protein/uncharacterized Fe-S cluster protein YjdI
MGHKAETTTGNCVCTACCGCACLLQGGQGASRLQKGHKRATKAPPDGPKPGLRARRKVVRMQSHTSPPQSAAAPTSNVAPPSNTSGTPPPSREQLLYWLHEAAEIEHHLMCCYLYAAFSLKRADPRWSPAQSAAVARWRGLITGVALEEMTHLCLVGNLMNALGAPPHMGRPPLPVNSGPYPAGFVIRLGPFCAATIEHFKYLERPGHAQLADAAGFVPERQYQRKVPAERLSPGPRDYQTVGELYEMLAQSLQACVDEMGQAALFVGDPRLQVDASLAPLPGVCAITDLASAQQALHTIVSQDEGAGAEHADSHFSRFSVLADELRAMGDADPLFEPAWPAATNPVMNAAVLTPAERVHVNHPGVARWLDIGNAIYTTSLRCLLQGFADTDRNAKATWLQASFALMRCLNPVGQGLAARPAQAESATPHAGLTFTPLRTLAVLPRGQAAQVLAERLGQLRERALALPVVPVPGETTSTWDQVIQTLARLQNQLGTLVPDAATHPKRLASTATASPSATSGSAPAIAIETPAAQSNAAMLEVVKGKALTLLFEARRCIHSRHCVLDAPTVFKANTPGEWIYPDTVDAETLVGVAHNCPSGAIRYQRHDGGPQESAPPVNTLRIRENGPYALHAELQVAGHDDGFRATLCRCGQSQRKPWCDGSHVSANFGASGEPASGDTTALAVRNGPLQITPLANGPLQVQGNLEMCAGTGRPVARTTQAHLCRCGQSKNKPFCDLSHVAAGFIAAGV